MSNWQQLIMPETNESSFCFVLFFQMQKLTDLEEIIKSPRCWRQKTSFKWTNPKQGKNR